MTTAKSRSVLLALVLAASGTFGCAPRVVAPSSTVRRVAVLPPCDALGRPFAPSHSSADGYSAPALSLADLLMSAARDELVRRGFDVLEPSVVETATAGRVPDGPEAAAHILADAHLDATALFMRVRRWEYAYPTMRTNELIAGLDVALVHPRGRVVWEMRRPVKPVPLHSEVLMGQADVIAAHDVMKEIFAALAEPRR